MGQGEFNIIHTADRKMKDILEQAANVAASRASVLITGESGTGKELLARYIHSKSTRASQALTAVNCAAVPETLLESELFGYEKGAFTGADKRKIGKFEQADQSTFLLDEISELPMLLQAKLLRVLQEGEVERLGAAQPVPVNVRLIATTNRNMSELVEAGLFREDLFYRLNVIPLEIPPLRERPADIRLLSKMFLESACSENDLNKKFLGSEAQKKIMSWKWPGNVRELKNVMERSALLSGNDEIPGEEILIEGYKPDTSEKNLAPGMTVSEAERLLILKTLEFTEQNRTQAARMLGISIRTLRNKLNEYKEAAHG